MRKLLVSPLIALLGISTFFVVASAAGVAAPAASLSSRAHNPAVVAEARAAFEKYMSSHAPRVSGGGWVSPQTQLHGTAKPVPGVATSFPSLNWSGFADTSATTTPDDFTYVSGNWTVPAVQCPPGRYRTTGAYISNWVGIDGFSDSTVEQLGTGAQCFMGVLYYYVWYEMFPGGTVEEGTPACINDNVDCVQPGDRISASVTVTPGSAGENNYTLALTDHTDQQQSFSVTASCATSGPEACADSSAEWVIERPAYEPIAGLFQFVPLVYYGQTGFTSGSLVANGQFSSIGGYQGAVYAMPMVDDSISYYLDCPGQQAPVGSVLPFTAANCPAVQPSRKGAFSVSWDSAF